MQINDHQERQRLKPSQQSKKRSSNRLTACQRHFQKFDSFGTSYSMILDGESSEKRSCAGSLCSFIVLAVTALYACSKFILLLERRDVATLSSIRDHHFSASDTFSYQDGLNVAVALTSYDNKQALELDPSYGSLVFSSYEWGVREDGTLFTNRTGLSHHPCTQTELGFADETEERKTKFFEAHQSSAYFAKYFARKFICPNEADMYIYGDHSEKGGRQINVQLNRCRGGEE